VKELSLRDPDRFGVIFDRYSELTVFQLPAGATAAPTGTAAAGKKILLTAARTVASAVPLATGLYWETSTTVGNFIRVGPANDPYVILENVADQQWAARSPRVMSPAYEQALGVQLASAANQAAWRRDGSPTTWNAGQETGFADPQGYANGFNFDITAGPGKLTGFGGSIGGQTFMVGSQSLSARQLQALPADPARLKALILTGYNASAGRPDLVSARRPVVLRTLRHRPLDQRHPADQRLARFPRPDPYEFRLHPAVHPVASSSGSRSWTISRPILMAQSCAHDRIAIICLGSQPYEMNDSSG
jgi:hypothetical protein